MVRRPLFLLHVFSADLCLIDDMLFSSFGGDRHNVAPPPTERKNSPSSRTPRATLRSRDPLQVTTYAN